MEEKGLESLMKKLGVKNFKELHEFLEYLKSKERS